MPISTEQKKEFNKQGYRVIDARFEPSPEEMQEETPKTKRKPRAKKV